MIYPLSALRATILPGTSHVSIASRADLLLPMIIPFLEKPL